MTETIMAPKPQPEPPLIWSASGLFRVEVDGDLMPHDVEHIEGIFADVLQFIARRAKHNAFARYQCDPIYMGM
jgi:hypothetical protein